MTEPLPKPWTVEDFLAWERRQPERYEFVGGVIRSNTHTIIKGKRVRRAALAFARQPMSGLG